MPGTDPAAYTNTDSYVDGAKLAEKGKFQMIFIADTPGLYNDLGPQTAMFPMDPMLALMAVARETKHIGLVATLSTTFNYPYNLARQFKALDVISHGREYYESRSVKAPFTVKKVKGWKDHIEDHLERSKLPFMFEYLNKQGFAKG